MKFSFRCSKGPEKGGLRSQGYGPDLPDIAGTVLQFYSYFFKK